MMIPKELTVRFHHSQVRKNQSNQDYVSIDGYINRLNDVLDDKWNWEVHDIQFRDGPPTAKGKPQYLAVTSGTLSIVLSDDPTAYSVIRRDGVGAGLNFDPDTAVKTAQAEALKKACHQYGIALYLWSEDEREFVQLQREAERDDAALKKLLVVYTRRVLELDPGTMPEADQMLEVLGMSDWDPVVARANLKEKGVL
jgi:hypothetical protein